MCGPRLVLQPVPTRSTRRLLSSPPRHQMMLTTSSHGKKRMWHGFPKHRKVLSPCNLSKSVLSSSKDFQAWFASEDNNVRHFLRFSATGHFYFYQIYSLEATKSDITLARTSQFGYPCSSNQSSHWPLYFSHFKLPQPDSVVQGLARFLVFTPAAIETFIHSRFGKWRSVTHTQRRADALHHDTPQLIFTHQFHNFWSTSSLACLWLRTKFL